jgi:hypothetical protein
MVELIFARVSNLASASPEEANSSTVFYVVENCFIPFSHSLIALLSLTYIEKEIPLLTVRVAMALALRMVRKDDHIRCPATWRNSALATSSVKVVQLLSGNFVTLL